MSGRWMSVVGVAGLAASAAAQNIPPAGAPGPWDAARPLPRYMTPWERWYVSRFPIVGTENPTPPPTGPVRAAGEYEPMDGIIISWMAFTTTLSQLVRHATTTGNADVYVALTHPASQPGAQSALTSAGANMSRVRFVVAPSGLNSVWVRDYGPRYVYQGDCRAIVDHKYNRPRPQDDVFPIAFSQYKKHAFYEHTLVHGGGNYHLDALGLGYATKLINNENPALTTAQIQQIWLNYQNCDTHIFDAFPTSVDLTQHLDMWMQVAADDKVIISDWPLNSGSIQDQICDNAAVFMTSRGYQVTRVPAFNFSGTHYTYTNMVICNDVVVVPSYTQSTVQAYNAQALAAVQSVFPNRTAVQVDCQQIIQSAGAVHCVVMHVPRHLGSAGPFGGQAPTAYLVSHNGGQTLAPGAQSEIRWISDDDVGTASVDLLLSTDGGQTFPTVIASAIADSGSYQWTVPSLATSQARLRVVVRDTPGNTGFDDGDGNFTIGSPCYADCNGDGALNLADFGCFQTKFAVGDPYADCNGDGVLNLADFGCFQTRFALGCP